MKKRVEKPKNYTFICIFLLFVVLCLWIIGKQEYKIYQVNKEIEATEQRLEKLKKDGLDLAEEQKKLDELQYIEKLAREEHNMVGKNEVPLFIVEDKPQKASDNKDSTSAKEQEKNNGNTTNKNE